MVNTSKETTPQMKINGSIKDPKRKKRIISRDQRSEAWAKGRKEM